MTHAADPLVSAQVLLTPASGRLPADREITAANVAAFTPDPATAAATAAAFAAAGFEVGALVGASFAITARRSVFDRFFGTTAAGARSGEVPLAHLPHDLRRAVQAVTFPPPPDFGPRSY
jgi:hypothetical protein